MIRSPGYVPERYLDRLECGTLDLLRSVYGVADVHHERRVHVGRTGCRGFRAVAVETAN